VVPTDDSHLEQYLHLADVTPDAVLLSWGGFWFRQRDTDDDGDLDGVLVDDEQLDEVSPRRRESMGARSQPFGRAVVEVHDAEGRLVGREEVVDRNHAWVGGLDPDTEYTYRVTVDGEPWGEGELLDWLPEADGSTGGLVRRGRRYARRFRTAPSPDAAVPLTFAVIGDFGFGVRGSAPEAEHQRRVARALERVVEERDVRLVLTVGDNIYLGNEEEQDTGAEDDDWFFTFYQPYRYVIDHVPVHPAVGNHDSSDEESSDDRSQLADNFFIEERFGGEAGTERSSLGPGLFYTFRFGRDIQLIAVDTSLATDLAERRFFDHPSHVEFLEEVFPDDDRAVRWRIPFMHHPPYCAGPHHPNTTSLLERLLPLGRRSGVRLVLSGHEHNFQHSVDGDIHFVITGAAGKLRTEPPTEFEAARTQRWAAEPHLLLVEVDHDQARVTPIGGCDEDERPRPIEVRTPSGEPVDATITIGGTASA
jgi:tartrate-resistant acid phosphatase type 5